MFLPCENNIKNRSLFFKKNKQVLHPTLTNRHTAQPTHRLLTAFRPKGSRSKRRWATRPGLGSVWGAGAAAEEVQTGMLFGRVKYLPSKCVDV